MFDLQGHRGARGLAPENTLPGFRAALAIGVTTLELDAAVTSDGIVVVCHDRRLNPDITRGPDGAWLEPPTPLVRALSFDELQGFDVGRIRPGSEYARRFPDQRGSDGVRMPALAEVFDLARHSPRVHFNIETKLSPLAPDEAALPDEFVERLLAAVSGAGVQERVSIQSFDWRSLRLVRGRAVRTPLMYLTAEETLSLPGCWTDGMRIEDHGSLPRMLRGAAGSGPASWSPDFRGLTEALVREARALDLGVVPWTVNEPADMLRAVDWGATGFITDYPDRARRVLAARGLELPPPAADAPV